MATLVEPDDAEFRVDLGVVLWRLRDFVGAEEQLRARARARRARGGRSARLVARARGRGRRGAARRPSGTER